MSVPWIWQNRKGYGATKGDAALIWILENGLGDAFTDEVKNTLGAVYDVLASVMKQGAAEAELAA
jgi:hemoglobin-like flavoprotein